MSKLCLTIVAACMVASQARPLDPHGIFCGSTSCYTVLEVKNTANESEIKKSYRALAKFWHPDKNDDPEAQKKFNAIAKAYETIGNEEGRKIYDHMVKNPSEYFKKYGEKYEKVIAPQTDFRLVLLGILTLFCIIDYAYQHQQYQKGIKIYTDAIVHAKGPTQGGSTEILEHHKKAKEKYQQQLEAQKNEKGSSVKRPKKQLSMKALKTDKEFEKVVQEHIFSEGLASFELQKPSVLNGFLIKGLANSSVGMQVRIALAKELTDEHKEFLLEKALGDEIFGSLTDEDLKDAIESEAWKKDNVEAWKEGHGFSEKKLR